jgi:hypothetical protein
MRLLGQVFNSGATSVTLPVLPTLTLPGLLAWN